MTRLKKTDEENEIKKSRKKYWKKFKKDKREIVKLSKKFKPYDYGFFLDIVFKCVDTMVEYYSDSKILHQDVSVEPFSTIYEKMMTALKDMKYYEENYNRELVGEPTFEHNESTNLQLYFKRLGDIITELWD